MSIIKLGWDGKTARPFDEAKPSEGPKFYGGLMGSLQPPSRLSCWNYLIESVDRVVDGDTIDITINLGFSLWTRQRVRIAGVDTPEKRTRDPKEKELGIDATNWLKRKLDEAKAEKKPLYVRTELGSGSTGKYGRLIGWLYVNDSPISINEEMIAEGYAWEYDGGTKNKNFEELKFIRRQKGTL